MYLAVLSKANYSAFKVQGPWDRTHYPNYNEDKKAQYINMKVSVACPAVSRGANLVIMGRIS